MKQYLDVCERILKEGQTQENQRTNTRNPTIINVDMEFDCSEGHLPVLTTRKIAWKSAIAEFLGYLKGYTSAEQFRKLGCKTWDANANENAQWLKNPHRKGKDDMGRVYGAQGRDWRDPTGKSIDQLNVIYEKLKQGIDDRRLIMTFWNPGELDYGCLAPCMHTHTFSLLNGFLYLTSYQR